MNVVVGSAFRNSDGNVGRYMKQVAALGHLNPSDGIRVVAVEGDSTDRTWNILDNVAIKQYLDVQRVKCEHGGPVFGSVETPERFAALSKVGNAIFDSVLEDDDVLLYVESDLVWDAPTASTLITRALARTGGFDVLAPLVMAGECLYDIWAFRKLDGERFSPFTVPAFLSPNGSTFEVSSVGSCLAMRGEVARRCRIRNDLCLVGWCEDARANGYKIGVCPDLIVRHP